MFQLKANFRVIFLLIMVIIISCSDDDEGECVRNEMAYVNSVEAPSEGSIGEKITMVVTFQATDGCGQFGKFKEDGSGMTKIIEVEAKHQGCNCYDNLPLIDTIYEFTPNSAGEHVFKFKTWQNEFIIVTVMVAEE